MSVPVLTHRRDLRQGDLVFPEEILRIGHTLDFQLDCVSKEVQQEVFGPELDTSSLCDWLNLHTAYDFALQDVADHIEITLCRNFGKKAHPFLYPLNRAERDVLRGEMEACCQRRTDRSLAQQYSHLLTTEEAEPPELTVGTHRLPMGEVGFAEDLSECGGLLQFYMPVAFAPDAVFGTHVATAENDGWLNVYAAYDLNTGKPCSALDVILVCGDSSEFAFRYPLAKQEQAALLENKGFQQAFALRCLPREVSRNLWSQAEFDSVTARKLCELRERFYPDTVQFPPEQMAVVLTDLYARGATIVSSEKGYGIYFRREDTLYFVELMAEDDRSAEVLMEAAREKEVIVERAVITVGAAQNLFLGEGTRQDYGMIRFDAEPFDVEESYMRLMMES